MTQNENDDPVS